MENVRSIYWFSLVPGLLAWIVFDSICREKVVQMVRVNPRGNFHSGFVAFLRGNGKQPISVTCLNGCSENAECRECVYNACTLVPTVFLRHGKTEFELPILFSVYPCHPKTEIVFRFPTTLNIGTQGVQELLFVT